MKNKKKRWFRIILYVTGVIVLVFAVSTYIFLKTAPQIGAKSEGVRFERILQSPNFSGGKFRNPVVTAMNPSPAGMFKALIDFIFNSKGRIPESNLPGIKVSGDSFSELPEDDVRITWLGHSTILIEINGQTLITDPMFGERASMVPFAGPKRFGYEYPISIDNLPKIDAVILSHDHYDHLDYQTIIRLHPNVEMFFVPLGVAAHLISWGVSSDKIVELDWWQESDFKGVKLITAPSRHFSGRGIADRFSTLWTSWIIQTDSHNLFFGGDSGYFSGFEEIGKRYGPFDITMLECGAYNQSWKYIHMMPEETAQAHLDLRGTVLLPIHWAKFNLSLHTWTEPIERLLRQAEISNVKVVTPMIGESFVLNRDIPQKDWWR
ncbi:MAG: MBL fold metallo-hydrolase [bacterium]|nr:MBL fold metallo-hydrolase [bacterium]